MSTLEVSWTVDVGAGSFLSVCACGAAPEHPSKGTVPCKFPSSPYYHCPRARSPSCVVVDTNMCINNSATYVCGQALARHTQPVLCEKNKHQILWCLADLHVDPGRLDHILHHNEYIVRNGTRSARTLLDELLTKTYCAKAAKTADFGHAVKTAVIQTAKTCMDWAIRIHAVEWESGGARYAWDQDLQACGYLGQVRDWLYRRGEVAAGPTVESVPGREAKFAAYARLLRAFTAGPLGPAEDKRLRDLGTELREAGRCRAAGGGGPGTAL